MRFAAAVAAATMAGLASASVAPVPKNGTAPAYVTEVVTAFTTFCPEATQITHAGETYTVTEATTLTITNCPGGCTVVKPATSSVVSVCNDCSTTPAAPAVPATTPAEHETSAAPTSPAESPVAPIAPYPSSNGTTPIAAPAPSGTGAPAETTAGTTPFEGAASTLTATGAGILAIFGLVAAL
ncbi:hypothetical protein MBLNU13_g08692t1 [Cladosporium sp. NU13]